MCRPDRWAEPQDFSFSVVNNPNGKRYDIALTSSATAPLCLLKENWPTEDGTFPTGYEGAVLTMTTSLLQPNAVMTVYSPGGCGEVRLEPGQTLRSRIAYAAFGDAEIVAVDPVRSISFSVHPFYCRR
jgi:hypothetical protein